MFLLSVNGKVENQANQKRINCSNNIEIRTAIDIYELNI